MAQISLKKWKGRPHFEGFIYSELHDITHYSLSFLLQYLIHTERIKLLEFWWLKHAGLPLPSFKKRIMANHKATKKDVRQASKRRDRNKFYGKTTRNAIRDLKSAKGNEVSEKFPGVVSMIDKLAKRGIIHKNKAANLKSKLARKVNVVK